MNKQLIRDLAITGGIYDCITDPYDKLKNGDPYSSVMIDLERFAEKIVKECIDTIKPIEAEPDIQYKWLNFYDKEKRLKEHFGVEE
jgi:hypothetical protein